MVTLPEIKAVSEFYKDLAIVHFDAHTDLRKEYLGEAEVVSVQKEKLDVSNLTAGETGGLALKTPHKIELQIGDRLKFFTRETKKRTL